MIKDFYQYALSLFHDEKDKHAIVAEHKRWPQYFMTNSDMLWFYKDSHFVIDDAEFLKRVLKQSAESWYWNPDVIGNDKATCIDRIRYTRGDWKYFWARSVSSLLENCIDERRYDTYPYELDGKPYQQKVFVKFLKKHGIHDFETMDECRRKLENCESL